MGVMTLESEQRKCTQTLLDSQFPTNDMRITIVTARRLTHSVHVPEYLLCAQCCLGTRARPVNKTGNQTDQPSHCRLHSPGLPSRGHRQYIQENMGKFCRVKCTGEMVEQVKRDRVGIVT